MLFNKREIPDQDINMSLEKLNMHEIYRWNFHVFELKLNFENDVRCDYVDKIISDC